MKLVITISLVPFHEPRTSRRALTLYHNYPFLAIIVIIPENHSDMYHAVPAMRGFAQQEAFRCSQILRLLWHTVESICSNTAYNNVRWTLNTRKSSEPRHKFIISGHVDACRDYTRNLKLVLLAVLGHVTRKS